ncbi:Phosphofructokinase family protein [Tritrichomonas foetus]|uniref:Phosphofructokinase family protein n=1 Tax=Tritrichomonas foetus TaxID=1144522 RepID=A0A1J4JTR5_9EUKA|nr:Phosphofructokinase family protein [Tritrichomonas foetus]|eukprot:OHT00892.1 Phosphofructokinase family protein [Tritrichomonas foetus]
MEQKTPILGIICGGGPAPGLNDVISAATLYARRLKWTVIAFHDGFLHLSSGDVQKANENMIELTEASVSSISRTAGSIIRTDRFDPTRSPRKIANTIKMLSLFNVRYLVIIGGNDKIMCGHLITQGVDPSEMSVVVVPKTINNDVLVPNGFPTFGFDSARVFGTKLINNLMMDARSAPRFFVVETMGKQTGHLALSLAEASGAHLVIIPEDFPNKVELSDIVDIAQGAVIKRLSIGKNYGVIIISEGLVNKLTSVSLQSLFEMGFVTYGSDGQIIYDDADLSRAIARELKRRFKRKGVAGVKFAPTKIGYELRSAKPNSYDAVYAAELGYGAVEGLRLKHSNCIVARVDDGLTYCSFRSMMDPETGRINYRKVDVNSTQYKICRTYTYQLNKEDFDDPVKLKKLAETAKMSVYEFNNQFKKHVRI